MLFQRFFLIQKVHKELTTTTVFDFLLTTVITPKGRERKHYFTIMRQALR